MNDNQTQYAAQIFSRYNMGFKPNPQERAFLQGLIDNMEAPERAGAIAAIIRIMLDIK